VSSHEVRNGVRIQRLTGTVLNKDILPLRFLNVLTLCLSIFLRCLIQFRRKDAALVVTTPPLLPFVVALACRIKGANCLLLIHDVFPDVLVAAGIFRRVGLAIHILEGLSRFLYRSVKRIVVLADDMAKLVARKMEGISKKISTIPNWADLDLVSPAGREGNALLKALGLQAKFILQYSGNLGRTHGLEDILAAAEMLRGQAEIQFLIIGSGAKRPWVEEQIRTKQLRNVTLLHRCLRAKLNISLNACDAAIVAYVPGMAGISVPSRMYNILAAGKPLLAVAETGSELARMVHDYGIGWLVPPREPARLVEAILQARADPERLLLMAARARALVENQYTFGDALHAYGRLLREL
jgi:glycosyltransferase involved in cell wall biosynthesis